MVAVTDAHVGAALVPVWRGHVLLLACAMLYLAWWVTFFRPGAQVRGVGYALGVACIVGAAACGLIGAPLVAGSLGRIPGAEDVPLAGFLVGGALAYLALLAVTTLALERQATTELVLIVAWVALEACVVTCLAAAGVVGGGARAALYVLIALLACASLVCYVLYYRLDPLPAFIDGTVPLVAAAIESAVMLAVAR
ncbi:hypothetical protein [Thermophilibacter immobilis]|jgi:hypothetical protein|uniref:Uncharacterized protein n=1 Tax=Thermophilibacter immobilis TaxID=2779519 RepID=A0A7S7M9P1_9ACTN|nr:hypothetical protein [Thermophilibacter immobilis]QOY61317.1 hypothetical protein INP52_03755 [Thermophilibacter immobilis]